MKRTVKLLYYRGVRQVGQLIEKQTNKIQNITYRGVNFIKKVQDEVRTSTMPKMYRGVSY
jgi:hypothetical protein